MNRKKKAWNRNPAAGSMPPLTTYQNLITPEQAADYLSVSVRTLAKYRSTGENNIPYVKIGRGVKYRLSDLDAYIAKHSHNVEVA